MLKHDIFGSLGNPPFTAFVSTNPNPGLELGTSFSLRGRRLPPRRP